MPLEIRRRGFAKFYDSIMRGYERRTAEDKRGLFAGCEGTVLEIGPGTGANLPLLPSGVHWIGVEPNRHMHAALLERAAAAGVDAEVHALAAERLPVEDASVDVAVSTLVLCSVPDPAHVLAELRRVLKPGGRFLFWEHVGAQPGTGLRTLQNVLTPVWKFCADGCRLNRNTAETIRAAGFESVELESFEVPHDAAPAIVRLHVRGVARK